MVTNIREKEKKKKKKGISPFVIKKNIRKKFLNVKCILLKI